MPVRAEQELKKITLNIYAGDIENIRNLYPRLHYSVVIREIIRTHIRQTEAMAEAKTEKLDLQIEMDLLT